MKHLKNFLVTYDRWLKEGSPEGKPYSRFKPLCENIKHSPNVRSSAHYKALVKELDSALRMRYAEVQFPFNSNDPIKVIAEAKAGRCHKNRGRNQFIRTMLEVQNRRVEDD